MPRTPDISGVSSHKPGTHEILIECTQIGNAVRVTAVDVATSVEINFQAPASTSRATIERLAKDKLVYVMKKGKI